MQTNKSKLIINTDTWQNKLLKTAEQMLLLSITLKWDMFESSLNACGNEFHNEHLL